MFTYLKERSHYEKIYDERTIAQCLQIEKLKMPDDFYEASNASRADKEKAFNSRKPLMLYMIEIHRASERNKIITDWMAKDRARDERIRDAILPEVFCEKCDALLTNEISRDYMHNNGEQDDILFIFSCDGCEKRSAYWEDGSLWEYKPRCEKCGDIVDVSHKRKGSIISTSFNCSHCKYEKIDTTDLEKNEYKPKKQDPHFNANRRKYCKSEQEGQQFVDKMNSLKKIFDQIDEEEKNKDVYDAIKNIEKLKLVDLKKRIIAALKKKEYVDLSFDSPEIGRDIIVRFNIQDAKTDREEYDSSRDLKKLIQESLQNTNWRLMSDGITCRLGILEGRLRGYERKEDLVKLVEKDKLK